MNAVTKNQAAVMEYRETIACPLFVVNDGQSKRANFLSSISPSTLAVAGCLIFLQVLDGVFTTIGVNRFGTTIEGNPFLRELMEMFGHVPTLAVLKLVAILAIVCLTYASRHLKWVRPAMSAVAGVYVIGAILPWTYILFIQ